MNSFVQQHASSVTGTLSGWDRIRFRGTLRLLAGSTGMGKFLSMVGCRLKDFKHYALGVSRQVRSFAGGGRVGTEAGAASQGSIDQQGARGP